MSGSTATKAQQQNSAGQIKTRTRELPSQLAMSGAYADILALQQSSGNQSVHGLMQGTVPPVVQSVLNNGGQPLEPGLRVDMESRFGQDFSQVRLHTDAQAVESAEVVSAKAYTVGRDVVFGQGRYAPDTSEGKRLLAHELAHVVQQGRGGQPPGPSHEIGAQKAAEQVGQGDGLVSVSGASGLGVARQDDELSVEDAKDHLQAVEERQKSQVLHPDEQKRLDEERKRLERLLFGETKEEQNERFARDIGLTSGPWLPPPTPKRLLTRAELTAKREKQAADRADLDRKRLTVERAEREKVLHSQPTDARDIWKKELAKAGVDQRPLTDFEVRLKAYPTAPITRPFARGGSLEAPAGSFQALYDTETGNAIAYYTYFGGADYTLVDINGAVVQQGDKPNEAPVIDPIDLFPVGGPAAKAAGAGIKLTGKFLFTQISKRAPRLLMRLRRTAALAMIGLSESGAAPRLAGGIALEGTAARAPAVQMIEEATGQVSQRLANAPSMRLAAPKSLGTAARQPAVTAAADTAEQASQGLAKPSAMTAGKSGAPVAQSPILGGTEAVETGAKQLSRVPAPFSPAPADVGDAAFKARTTRDIENVMRANMRNTIGSGGEAAAQASARTTTMDLNALKTNAPQLDTISRETGASVKAFGVDKPLSAPVVARYVKELQALRTAVEPGVPTKLGKAADLIASHREAIQAAGAWPNGLARNATPEQIAKFINQQGVVEIPADHVGAVRAAVAANARADPAAYGLTPGAGLDRGIERLTARVQSLGLTADEIMTINKRVWGNP
jgi:hypothetical protein